MSTTILKDASEVQMARGREAVLELRRNAQTVVNNTPAIGFTGGLAETLDEVEKFLRRFIAFPSEAHAPTVALWIAHTWMVEAFDYSPYLHIGSPVKRCGKSRLLDCLRVLSRNPWAVVSPTEAVLYRKIEADCPTLLLDEVDTIFTAKADDNREALRALLNAGFERRATVPRCVGPQHVLTEFRVFCPKALAGIGKLPDTVADRSVSIVLARRMRRQEVEKFRTRDVEVIATPIADRLRACAEDQSTMNRLRTARPSIPDELGDRAQDICEPLLAIADMAGGDWPRVARVALVELCTGAQMQDDNTGVMLLGALREVFREKGARHLTTKEVLEALIARENGEPWAQWWERDFKADNVRGVAGKLAKLLKPFGVIAQTIRDGETTAKGYKLEAFEDAFGRYLGENAP